MKKERHAITAGLFILISVALGLTTLLSIKGVGRLAEPQQVRQVSFKLSDDIGGLRTGEEVRIGGFRVGHIRGIETVELDTPTPKLLVTIMLPSKFKFHTNSRIGVQTSLTGSSVLNIDNLGTGAELPDGQQLIGVADPKTTLFASIGETIPKIGGAVESFKETGKTATAFVQHLNEKVDPLSGKVTMVTDKAGSVMDSVNDIVGPGGPDLKSTFANVNAITTNLKDKLPEMINKVDKTVDNTRAILEDVQQTVANTKDVSASVRTVISGNKGKLESVIASVKTTGDNLKAASTEIRHSPWRLLYQPKTEELSNLNLFDSARQFAEGANELNDAAQALRDAAADKNTDAKQMQQLVNRLEKTFANFHEVEQKLWKDVKE